MISILLGSQLPLKLQLKDGTTDKFIKAHVFNGSNSLVTSVTLTHLTSGLYVGYWTPVTAGPYHAVYILYSDNTYTVNLGPYYENTSDVFMVQSLTDIGESIWNTDISDNNLSNSAAKVLKDITTSVNEIDASHLADLVWNKLTTDFNQPNSFGLLMNLLNQRTLNIENELNDSVDGLEALKGHITNKAQEVIDQVNANEIKIDQIIPAVNSIGSSLSGENSNLVTLLQNLSALSNQNKADIISEINQNETKLDEIKTNILSLSNNTTVRFVVPDQMIRPETGVTTYKLHLRLFDDLGNPEAPDSTPTIIVKDIVTSATQSGSMVQDGSKVGAYYYDYGVASGSAVNPLFIEVTVVENGVTRYIPATSQIVEFNADLNAIQTQLAQVDTKVTDTQNKVNSGVYGLEVVKSAIDTNASNINNIKSNVSSIKTTTDALPSNIATTTNITSVLTAISALPTLTQISNQLTIVRDAIMGTSGKTNTDVYNRFDISGLLQANDSRLANLDAKISTRSTLTVADVWSYASRTLTAITIPSVEAKKIWDVLLTDVSSGNSFGSLIKTMLDAAITSRGSVAEIQSLLGGVAQETSLGSVLSTIVGEVNQNEVKINTIITLLNAIGPNVTDIKNSKSLESTVANNFTAVNSTLSNLNLIINAIKTKTDNIPSDPAKESTVSMRPTNPVLNTDSRLSNLDAKVSTRSTVTASQLSPLAKTTDVVSETSTIISSINGVLNAINTVLLNIDPIPTNTEMNAKLSSVTTLSALEAAKDQIISAISNISSGGGAGISISDIWNHPTRTLTGDVTIDDAQYDNLSKASDVTDYKFDINTSLLNGNQTVFVGISKQGKSVSVDGVSVSVKKDDGSLVWSAMSDANSDGVHILTSPVSLISNKVYYIKVIAEINSEIITYNSPFTTVG